MRAVEGEFDRQLAWDADAWLATEPPAPTRHPPISRDVDAAFATWTPGRAVWTSAFPMNRPAIRVRFAQLDGDATDEGIDGELANGLDRE
jgi:hypothetical protein